MMSPKTKEEALAYIERNKLWGCPEWSDILEAEDGLTLFDIALELRRQLDETLDHYEHCLT